MMLIHLRLFPLLIWYVSHSQAFRCTLYGKACTFTGLKTSETDIYMQPSAADNSAVEKVEFKDSFMPYFTEELCKTFPNLKEIWADDVSIKEITPNAFHECKKLKVVAFLNNKVTHLDPNTFVNNPLLEEFYFKNNSLKDIDGKVFAPVKDLTHLSLSVNFLTEFPIKYFPVLDKLQVLYLYMNDLTDLDANELVQKFPNLKTIYLHNNLFDCDRLPAIIDIIRKQGANLSTWGDNYTRNANLPKVENIECVRTFSTGMLTKKLAELEELHKNQEVENRKLASEVFHLFVVFGVILSVLILAPGVWYVINVVKSKQTAKTLPNKDLYDYYYEDTETEKAETKT